MNPFMLLTAGCLLSRRRRRSTVFAVPDGCCHHRSDSLAPAAGCEPEDELLRNSAVDADVLHRAETGWTRSVPSIAIDVSSPVTSCLFVGSTSRYGPELLFCGFKNTLPLQARLCLLETDRSILLQGANSVEPAGLFQETA